MLVPRKVYPVKNNGKDYFLIKYQPLNQKAWKSKYAPVDRTDKESALHWFDTVFCAAPVTTPEKKSIVWLMARWLEYRKEDENLINIKSHLKLWILPNAISTIDLETEQEPKVCRDFIESIPRAPFTVRNVVQTVRMLIDDARKNQWICFRTVNMFADPIVTSAINNGKTVVKSIGDENTISLEKEQVRQLLNCKLVGPERSIRYMLAISAGLRDAELSGLQWKDLDLNGSTPQVKVERQLRRYPGIKSTSGEVGDLFKPPKKGSYRTISLHPKALEALIVWKESGWKVWTGRKPTETDAVFPNQAGQHYRPNSAIFFRKDLKKAKLSQWFEGVDGRMIPFDFHATRRSFASLLEIEVGLERAKISALLGHKSGGVTAKHYLTRNKATCAEAIKKLPL